MAPKNEWTLMFFFAGDNNLSPLMVSELKAIKDAGFQQATTVLVHFDPNPLGAPTRIYNVNRRRKELAVSTVGARHSRIGDGSDSFVRNLIEDKVDPYKIDESAGAASAALKEALKVPDALNVGRALELFLGFARENHSAKHYILFLVGHGMVVANDAFLPDENPVSAITLNELDKILRPFSENVRGEGGDFELLALHSCSMSSIEVAYQLKGTANYMMGTEGLAFIGSWPYRQLLKRTFNAIEGARGDTRIPELVRALHKLSLHNGTDFMAAGYSSEIALCRLRKEEVERLNDPVKNLVAALKRGLDDKRATQLILLAHWKSQSYWEETFTDLFDFCQCLSESCDNDDPLQASLIEACDAVMRGINQVVEVSEGFGPTYQYSHGLSVYFPWSRPIENMAPDAPPGILKRYESYAFTRGLGDDTWLSFIERYLDVTRRETRAVEDGIVEGGPEKEGIAEEKAQLFKAARESFNPFGVMATNRSNATLAEKPLPSVGVSCDCPSIKNYPQETERFQGESKLRNRSFSITEGALEAFTEAPPEGDLT